MCYSDTFEERRGIIVAGVRAYDKKTVRTSSLPVQSRAVLYRSDVREYSMKTALQDVIRTFLPYPDASLFFPRVAFFYGAGAKVEHTDANTRGSHPNYIGFVDPPTG